MKTLHVISIMVLVLCYSILGQTAGDAVRIRFDELGFGARNLAMGVNGVVSADDYSAIFWNPAGLASMKNSQFMGEFSHLRFSNEATFSNNLNSMEESFTRLRTAGLAVSLPTTRGSLVLGLGYNFVRDFDDYLFFSGFNSRSNGLEFELQDDNGVYDWYPFDRDVFQTEEVISEGGLHQWSFAGAVAISPNVDVGATMNFWSGREEYGLRFNQQDSENFYNVYPGDFESYELNQSLVTEYRAFSLKLGGKFKLNRAVNLGMAMEFPTTFRIIENYSSNDALIFDDGFIDEVEFEPGEWEYRVKTPYRFDAGVGFNAENILLNGSITYRDWSETRFEKPKELPLDSDYAALLDENRNIQRDYRATINYHLGGELRFPNNNLSLRGGYAVYPSPLKDATSELDKKVYSGGVGLKIGRNTFIDATYLRSNWSRGSEDDFTPGGTLEEITENRILLGLRFNF
jgi:long-subunit fatty acid transport protein